MNSTRYGLLATITAFSACGTLLSPIVAQGQEEASQETEVLTRGPVHEAFAETVSFEPEAGILISTQPPEPIDELPPEQELEGDNVTWIAGYWAWDEDLNDFMWISGVWRNVPPDREWVPGYWNDVGSQWQWVSGYWADAGTEEVTYLPEPPRSLERGPSIAAPSDDDVWVPGSWTYVDTRYRWRPGYWQPYRQNWAYVPDRYSWTPRGYVFVAGYWDYPVVNRGIIFAPVRFHGPVWRQPHYHYSPVTVINLGLVVNHLFVRPSYGHYYFGDYYEPRYANRGFYSSVSYASVHNRGFDPIFSYQRWEHRHDHNWERNRMDDYNYFRDNRDARPPQTWAALRDVGDGRRGFRNREGKEMAIATPLQTFAKNPTAAVDGGGEGVGMKQRFKNLNQASRDKIVNQRQEMKSFAQKRKQIEREAPAPVAKAEEGQPAPAVKPTKAKFQRSPVVGRKASQLAPDQAPPKRKAAPAIAEKDPTPDEKAKPDDNQPDQPGRPGRGQGGRGQGGKGKGEAQDDTAKPDTTPDRMPKKDDEATPEREPKVKPQPEREPKVRPQPKKEEGTEREPKEKTEPQPKPEREPRVKPQPDREPKEPQPEREPKVKPQPNREPKEPQPEREPKVKPQPDREPKESQPEREPKVKPQTERAQPQPQPKRERVVEPQPKKEEAQPQPKRERVQPQPKKEEAQPQVKRQQVQPQPQPQPKREQASQPQRERVQPQGGGGGGGGGGKGGRGKEKDKEAAKE